MASFKAPDHPNRRTIWIISVPIIAVAGAVWLISAKADPPPILPISPPTIPVSPPLETPSLVPGAEAEETPALPPGIDILELGSRDSTPEQPKAEKPISEPTAPTPPPKKSNETSGGPSIPTLPVLPSLPEPTIPTKSTSPKESKTPDKAPDTSSVPVPPIPPVPAPTEKPKKNPDEAIFPTIPGTEPPPAIHIEGSREPVEQAPDTPEGVDTDVLNRFDSLSRKDQIDQLDIYQELDNTEMVQALGEKILANDPDSLEVHEILAGAALKRRDIEESLYYTGRLMDLNPTSENQGLRASALSMAGRKSEAVPILERLKAEDPQSVFPLQPELAFGYLETGRTTEAKTAFQEIIKTAGYPPLAVQEAEQQLMWMRFNQLVENGNQAIKKQDIGGARKILDTLETEFPKQMEVQAFKARVLAAEGRHDDALAVLNDLKLKKKKNVFEGQLDIGYVYMELKDWMMARDAFNVIIETPGYPPGMIAAAKNAKRETHLHEQIEIAHAAAKKRDKKKVREVADWAVENFPKNADAHAINATAYALEGDHETAESILNGLGNQAPKEEFGQDLELAEAKFDSGEFEAAAADFQQFIDQSGQDESDRFEAFYSLNRLRRDYLGQVRAGGDYFDASEGQQFGMEGYARTGMSANGWRADGVYHRDEIDLSNGLLRNSRYARQEGAIGIEKFFSSSHYVRAYGGASDDDALGGMMLGKSARSINTAWMLEVAINKRSTDTLTLRAADGRENRVGFNSMLEISERMHASFNGFLRRIEIDGSDIGDGFGTDWELAYRINPSWNRFNVALAYTGSYYRFDPDSGWVPSSEFAPFPGTPTALVAEMVDEEYHRHGLELRVDGLIGENLAPYASAGAHYRFDGTGFEYSFAAGLEWFLTSATSLSLGASYISNGRAGNSDSDVFEAAASLRHSF